MTNFAIITTVAPTQDGSNNLVTTTPDGGLTTVGTTTDVAYTSGGGTVVSILKGIWTRLRGGQATMANSLPVVVSSDQTLSSKIADGVTPTNTVTVAALHNADNQSLPVGTTYGLLTGGVAQLKNVQGNLDRQTETGTDGIPALGIATGTQQLAAPFATTIATSIALNTVAQAVTPAAMTGIQAGSVLTIDAGANAENVVVISVTGTTFTAVFTKNHTGPGIAVAGFTYNQARDASVGDNIAATGLSPSVTYLYNAISGKYELDRSASGERDGATGSGTAVAAEYEYNGGGPLTNTGAESGLSYDRARNIQGKAPGASTLNGATTAGATSIVLNAVTGLSAGEQIILDRGTANKEAAYVGTAWNGVSLTVPLQSALQFSHSNAVTAEWDFFGSTGPGLSGFTATGIGIEEEALYDPVTDKFYLERAATQDGVVPQNVVLESLAVWNGTTMDRATGSASRGLDVSLKTLVAGEDQTNNVMKVEQRFSYNYVSTATTTTVKSGAGFLHTLVVQGGTTGTVIIYDNTAASGNIIASFDSTNAIAAYPFNVSFATGLTIVTAAATKLTVSYR